VLLRRFRGGAAHSPLPERFKDDIVSFRSRKFQKFRYCRIELCRFRLPALLTHGQISALKRCKSAFLLVSHPVPHFVYRALSGAARTLRQPPLIANE